VQQHAPTHVRFFLSLGMIAVLSILGWASYQERVYRYEDWRTTQPDPNTLAKLKAMGWPPSEKPSSKP
jgi:hypothetical protein